VGTITGVTPGTGLLGGGTAGNVTLSIDKTKVATLSSVNVFANSQVINGGLTVATALELGATSSAFGGQVDIGGVPFLQGYGTSNVFVGDAGNFTTTGSNTTGVGHNALHSQTSGVNNTATGYGALVATTTGFANTGSGLYALFNNTTGTNNTAIGAYSGPISGKGNLTNTTAVGANALVAQSNTLVLGNTTTTPGAEFVNVGIGTASPVSSLEISVNKQGGLGPALTLTNPGGPSSSTNDSAALDFNTRNVVPGTSYNPQARIVAVDDGQNSDMLVFLSNNRGAYNNGLTPNLFLESNGRVTAGGVPNEGFADQMDVNGQAGFNGIRAQGGFAGYQETKARDGVTGLGGLGAEGVATSGGDFVGHIDGGTGGTFYGGDWGGNGAVFTGGRDGDGIFATTGSFVTGDPNTYTEAGVFAGNVSVSGTIGGGTANIVIDHPLDPANQNLEQSVVASSERINVYSGNVVTDDLGVAVVHLPEWFEAENGDFRYQLTVIGGRFAQAIVSEEIHDHRFTISTNATQVKVSWQVTGVRQDAFAKAHPLVVERPKIASERGFYLHPELYGQPEEKQTEWARHPVMMREIKKHRSAAPKAQATGASSMP
jgi:hypothetical protein